MFKAELMRREDRGFRPVEGFATTLKEFQWQKESRKPTNFCFHMDFYDIFQWKKVFNQVLLSNILQLHPGRLTWNLRIQPWKRKIIDSKPSFSGSMLNFRGVPIFSQRFFDDIFQRKSKVSTKIEKDGLQKITNHESTLRFLCPQVLFWSPPNRQVSPRWKKDRIPRVLGLLVSPVVWNESWCIRWKVHN